MPDTIEAKTRNAPSKPSFAAFVSDESIAAVTKAAEEIGLTQPRVVRGTVTEATRRLADVSTPKQLVVDISGSADPLAAMASLAEVCDEGTQVIALGDVNDVELYRSLIASGVHDYLVKPVSAEAIAAVCASERDPAGNCGRDHATSEGCRRQLASHRARRSQLAQVAQRSANGAACNRSSPIGPPQTSHVS